MKKIDHFHREVKKQFHSSRIKLYSKIQGEIIYFDWSISFEMEALDTNNFFIENYCFIETTLYNEKNSFKLRDVPGAVLPENDNVTNNNNSPTEENNHFYSNLPEPPPYKR